MVLADWLGEEEEKALADWLEEEEVAEGPGLKLVK